MKTFRGSFLLPAWLPLGLLAITGCDINVIHSEGTDHVRGSGVSAEDTRDVGHFEKLAVSHAIQVEAAAGDQTEVAVRGDDNIVPLVMTEVRGGTLHVEMQAGTSYSSREPLLVEVTTPQLSAVTLSGASRLKIEQLDTEDFTANISGASTLQVAGKAEKVKLNASGASKIAATELLADDVEVKISGASNVRTLAQSKITGHVSGASTLEHVGTAEKIDVQSSGASTIRRRMVAEKM